MKLQKKARKGNQQLAVGRRRMGRTKESHIEEVKQGFCKVTKTPILMLISIIVLKSQMNTNNYIHRSDVDL